MKDSLTVFKENLDIAFATSDSVHFEASETFHSSYETPYENRAIFDIEQGKLLSLPLLVEKQNGLKVMIAEAGDIFELDLAPGGGWVAIITPEK